MFRELLCQHKWLFWHTRFIVDTKSLYKWRRSIRNLNGKIEYNQFRQCEKCGKKQMWRQRFEGSKWIRSYRNLDPNNRNIDKVLKIPGEESITDKRDRLINQILKK